MSNQKVVANDLQKMRFRKIEHTKITITSVYCQTIKEVISSLKNPIFDAQFESQYAKALNELVFIFQIGYEDQFWEIRRTAQQFFELENQVQRFYQNNKKLTHQEVKVQILPDTNETFKNLTNFLKNYISNIIIPDCVLNFLELSCISLPLKFKECFLLRDKGGKESSTILQNIQDGLSRQKRRYFIITQSSLLYLNGPEEKDCIIKECLNFDHTFSFQYGEKQTGESKGIVINFLQRKLTLEAETEFIFIDFIYALFKVTQQSPYTKLHRYGSFAPFRMSECQWYVDGNKYFSDVYDALLQAKQTVFITDWWLSPELYLKRPINPQNKLDENNDSRLMHVLKYIADRGVNVLVILYYSSDLVLYNNPKHAQKQLESMSPNIKVFKHPNTLLITKFSHHEKMVVIDQKIAFMGGLDLCYGRWDDSRHLLFDPHPNTPLWPEIDFSNSRIRDFGKPENVENYQTCLMKENEPRMPWHDIAIQIRGDSVIDLSRHFSQYWNFCMSGLPKKEKLILLHPDDQEIFNYEKKQIINYSAGTQDNESEILLQSQEEDSLTSYLNAQQLNQNEKFQQTKNIQESEYLIPAQNYISDGDEERFNIIIEDIKPLYEPEQFLTDLTHYQNQHQCVTQLARSSSIWSTGIKFTELSIQNAYLQLISKAKSFIYIENQFFISNSAGDVVKNSVSFVLVERIKLAHKLKQKFKVIVFMPLLPGFEGEIDQDNSTVLKVQLHYEYFTISRGGRSIIEQLKSADINPSDYINFYGLRQHGKSQKNVAATEIVYIHSKLLIVDDEIALIGSANINDRSLNGDRDSELAIIVEDQIKVDSFMNGVPVKVSKFSHTLRTTIFSEHFDLSYEQVQDPLSIQLQNEIKIRTLTNTNFYRQIFRCYPDDKIKKVKDYAQFKKIQQIDLYDELSQFIKGFAVEFPLNFLCDENLNVKIYQKEYLAGPACFT